MLDLSVHSFGHLGDYRAILGGWFDHPGVRTTVACHPEHGPVGYVMQAFVRREFDLQPIADLVAIAVEPALRRHGIARLLLRAALDLARTEARLIDAADRMRLEVAVDNVAARTLFVAAGFVHRPRGDGRYPNGQRYLCLERRLEPPAEAVARA